MNFQISEAAANGDIELVKNLIANGCDVNQRGRDGMTPLSVSAFWGYTDIVATLLSQGADVNAVNKRTIWTALHCASFQGHGPVILCLLKAGADVDVKDADGRTPADFGSAMDAIWPLFAAVGCTRTSKQKLIDLKVITKSARTSAGRRESNSSWSSQYQQPLLRPKSSYVLTTDHLNSVTPTNSFSYHAAISGDVLANEA